MFISGYSHKIKAKSNNFTDNKIKCYVFGMLHFVFKVEHIDYDKPFFYAIISSWQGSSDFKSGLLWSMDISSLPDYQSISFYA